MKKIASVVTAFFMIAGIKGQTNTYPYPSSASIGIGTTTPSEKLTVIDNNDGLGLGIYRNNTGSSNFGTYLNFGALDGSSNKTIGSAILGQLNANKTSGELHFYTKSGSSLLNRMSIDPNGNVGIGTTSPNTKLEVNGNIFTSSQTNYLQFGTAASTAPYVSGDADGNLHLGTRNASKLTVTETGKVGIGTISPAEKLSVDGNVYTNGNIFANGFITTKKLTVTQLGWSDYVFHKDYKLQSLSSLESFIKQNKRLPDVPSAKEVEEKGINVGDNQALLLKKIEELTLYMIQQGKEIKALKRKVNSLTAHK